MATDTSIYRWQERALGPLLGWGIGSVVAGAGLATAREPMLRHVGLQALGWGLIDALLALNGRIGARRKLRADHTRENQRRDARRFEQLVAVNAVLDIGYVVGGLWLAQRKPFSATRRGTGFGIAIQGAWLLGYDLQLLGSVRRWQQVERGGPWE